MRQGSTRVDALSVLAAFTGPSPRSRSSNGPTAQAALPTPVSASTARTYLAGSPSQAEGSSTGYSRDLFPHWITQSAAPATPARSSSSATARTSSPTPPAPPPAAAGTPPYDGATWTAASDLDIDHMVPLAEAWHSGASSWTTAQRQAFANDLTRPQLIAVTDNVNQSKGDQDPAEWLPSRTAYHCTYARAWVQVKHYYDLTVDSAEKSALQLGPQRLLTGTAGPPPPIRTVRTPARTERAVRPPRAPALRTVRSDGGGHLMAGLRLGPLLRYVDWETGHRDRLGRGRPAVHGRSALRGRRGGHAPAPSQIAGHHYALVVVTGLTPGTTTAYEVLLGRRAGLAARPDSPFPASTITHPRRPRGRTRSPRPSGSPSAPAAGPRHRPRERRTTRSAPTRSTPWPPGSPPTPAPHAPTCCSCWATRCTRTRPRRRPAAGSPPAATCASRPAPQVADYEEYTRLYDESWLDPEVRWLLSTVPSCMIFDDHDVIDDWNTSAAWLAADAGHRLVAASGSSAA